MSIIIPANTLAAGGFDVDNSLRFNDGSSDYLNRAQGTPTNADKFTLSVGVKRCSLTTNAYHYIASFDGGSNPREHIRFNDGTDQLTWYFRDGSGTASDLTTNRLFRDVSAWYHILCVYDSTQGTNSNRQKIYVNGVQETSFSSSGYVAQNTDSNLNTNSNNIKIGVLGVSSPEEDNSAGFFDGYMAEYVFIDGSALAPDQFGEFDEDSGIWKPINVSGLTFGDNGFYLEFKQAGTGTNASGMGADTSGNTNHFAVNNLTAVDQSTDTCTNNFATLNPLSVSPAGTLTEGSTKILGNSSSESGNVNCTFAMTSGKWWFEAKVVGDQGSYPRLGAAPAELLGRLLNGNGGMAGQQAIGFQYESNGNKVVNTSSAGYGASFGANDIIGCALDLDNKNVYYYKNGAIQNSGTALASGSTHFGTGKYTMISCAVYPSGQGFSFNFGNPAYAISSGNADANGYGNFEYAVPSGYFALCTKNLAEYG